MIFKGTCSKCGRIIKLEVKIPKITDDSYDDYERYERARDERYISAGNVANEINWKYTQSASLDCPVCNTTLELNLCT